MTNEALEHSNVLREEHRKLVAEARKLSVKAEKLRKVWDKLEAEAFSADEATVSKAQGQTIESAKDAYDEALALAKLVSEKADNFRNQHKL